MLTGERKRCLQRSVYLKTKRRSSGSIGMTDNLPRSGRPEVLSKRDKRAILCVVWKHRSITRANLIRRIYTPHVSLRTIDRLFRQHNIKVTSEEATGVKGGTRKGPALMGSCTQGLVCGGIPSDDLQRRVQCGAGTCGTAGMGFQHAGTGEMACRLSIL